jgi:hypothetical protein
MPAAGRGDFALRDLDELSPANLVADDALDLVLALSHARADRVERETLGQREQRDGAEAVLGTGSGTLVLTQQVRALPDPRVVDRDELAAVAGSVLGDHPAGADDETRLDPRLDGETIPAEAEFERVGDDRVLIAGLHRTSSRFLVERCREVDQELVVESLCEFRRRRGIFAQVADKGAETTRGHGW